MPPTVHLQRGSPSSRTHAATELFAEHGRQRLRLVALMAAALPALELLATLFLFNVLAWEAPESVPRMRFMQAGLIVSSLGLYFAAGMRMRDTWLVNIGLAYQIVSALFMCSRIYWGDSMLPLPIYAKFTPLAVWILLFPLIVPAPPLRALLAGLATASTAPFTFLVWCAWTNQPVPDEQILVETFIPIYVCVGLAVFPSTVIHQLTDNVAKAQREIRELGSYRLIEKLGAGGMGEVWRAEHCLLARPAAIKLIKPEVLDAAAEQSQGVQAEIQQRFEREARAAASLESPNSIGVYDYGVSDDGTFYFVMELLDGIDLWSLVRRFGPISPPRVVFLLQQCCLALEEAHRAGMVHRDIKPANIFLCRRGTQLDFVKVLDFGLVSVTADRTQSTAERLTQRGFVVGTPAFMSPEQCAAKNVDKSADIYALGCVAYWLLTGHQVFEERDIGRLLDAQKNDTPELPSVRLGKPLPDGLEQVIMECLSKDPAERPSNCQQLALRLGNCRLKPEWSQKDAQRWWHLFLPGKSKPVPISKAETALLPVPGATRNA